METKYGPVDDMIKEHKKEMTGPDGETRVFQLLLNCALYFEREINKVLQPFGLKHQQFCVLNEIIVSGPLSQKELCEKLFFEKSNISKIVKMLLEKNLLRVTSDPIDRRLMLLSESPCGEALLKNAVKAFDEFSAGFFNAIAPEESAGAMRLIKIMQKEIKKRAQ